MPSRSRKSNRSNVIPLPPRLVDAAYTADSFSIDGDGGKGHNFILVQTGKNLKSSDVQTRFIIFIPSSAGFLYR